MSTTAERTGTRRWTLVGLCVLGASAGVLWWLWSLLPPSPVAPAAAAYRQGDWLGASRLAQERVQAVGEDPRALRLWARASARLGRHAAARAVYDRLGGRTLEAEDHYLLGLGWRQSGRPDAAQAAWRSALEADPNHAETLSEMARTSLHQEHPLTAAGAAERLARQPGWEAQGWLLLGMIRASDHDPAGAAEALRQALQQDPGARLAPEEPYSTHKLLARMLLQAGRPIQARETLRTVLNHGPDPEASWLLSRVALREHDRPAAAAALAQAGTYRADHPLEAEPAPYLGAARCGECHGEVARAVGASRHARTYRSAAQLADFPLPDRPLPDPNDPQVVHALHRVEGTIQLETRVADKVLRAIVDYALGARDRYTCLVGRDEQGTVRVLRLSHYQGPAGSGWDRTKDQPPHPQRLEDFLGEPYEPPDGTNECLKCHTTTARSARERTGPEAADHAIGCEGCHGPGGLHPAALAAPFPDSAILNPARASPAALNQLCGRCHSQHLLKMPSSMADPAWARFPGSTLPQSRCYTESGAGLSCSTCHDPHRDVETSSAFYEARCLSCHTGRTAPETAATTDQAFRSTCPVNARGGCLSCHMPKVPYPSLHTTFTDHYIRVPRRAASD